MANFVSSRFSNYVSDSLVSREPLSDRLDACIPKVDGGVRRYRTVVRCSFLFIVAAAEVFLEPNI